jgi:hypothetical protein
VARFLTEPLAVLFARASPAAKIPASTCHLKLLPPPNPRSSTGAPLRPLRFPSDRPPDRMGSAPGSCCDQICPLDWTQQIITKHATMVEKYPKDTSPDDRDQPGKRTNRKSAVWRTSSISRQRAAAGGPRGRVQPLRKIGKHPPLPNLPPPRSARVLGQPDGLRSCTQPPKLFEFVIARAPNQTLTSI